MSPSIAPRDAARRLLLRAVTYAAFLAGLQVASAPLRRANLALVAPEPSRRSVEPAAQAAGGRIVCALPVRPAVPATPQPISGPTAPARSRPAPKRRRSPGSEPMVLLPPGFWPPNGVGLPSPEELARMALIREELARLEREQARRFAGAR